MVATVDLPAREMSETFHDMRSRLHGLSEDEFFWMPGLGELDRLPRRSITMRTTAERSGRSATSSA